MIDRKTIIKELEETGIMLTQVIRGGEMSIMEAFYCFNRITDMLTVLKKQEPIAPVYNEEKYGDHLPHCGNCEKVLPNSAVYGQINFCHYCGKAVKND